MAIKRGRSKRIALAAAAMMAMESDVTRGPCVSSAHPLHLLSLSPIKLPLFSAPRAGKNASRLAFVTVAVFVEKLARVPEDPVCLEKPTSSFGFDENGVEKFWPRLDPTCFCVFSSDPLGVIFGFVMRDLLSLEASDVVIGEL